MDKTKKKTIKKIVSWVMLAVVVTVLAVMPLLAGSSEESDGPEASILSAQVEFQDIDTMLIGGGTLASQSELEVTVPSAVKLTKYLVSNGDMVSEGDPIAYVDRVSVMSAITQVQETLEYLSEEIEDESSEVASKEVSAQAGGTVKLIYAQAGDSVSDVMLEHGALAVLSLDGLMAVQIQRNTELTAGDTVCVTLADDTEVEGRVESNLAGVLTVTVDDDDYEAGQTVVVTTEDGDRIGSGALYIHSAWNATAYSGTVKSVSVSEGKSVSAGTTLLTLQDTGNTAKYQQLVNQRREYEELMLELFVMYQTETIAAPGDGVVYGVDDSGTYMLSAEGSWSISLLSTPFGEDDSAYANIVAHITEISTDGNWIVNYNSNSFAVTDYTNPEGYPSEMNDSGAIPIVAVYAYIDGAWVQSSAAVGDIILVATDAASGAVWAVKVGYSAVETEPDDGEDPDDTEDPVDPEAPVDPDQPSQPDTDNSETPTMPSGSMGQSGGLSGMIGGITQEETFETYSLETVTIATVTPRQEMILEITIDELDINKLYIGQSAMVTVEALSGESFDAVITEIGNSGTSDGGNAKFTVELTMDCDESMLTGMTASAFITLDTQVNVLTVPVAALNGSGSETYVYTSYDEEKDVLGDPVTVTVGVSDGENAQILSGLEEGTTVYYAYYDTLTISNTPKSSGFSFG